MKKTLLPEGFSDNTPLSFFINNPDYAVVYTVEDVSIVTRVKKIMPEDKQFIATVNAKINELSKFPTTPTNDLFWISTALSLVEFIDEHADNIKQHFSIAADITACVLMCLYRVSDEVKNRNLDIIPDSGWKLFDLLAKLLYLPNDKSPAPNYFLLQQLIQPKIVDEIRSQMRFVLQQMHDTESLIQNLPHMHLRCHIYRNNPELFAEVVKLQQDIEKAIETGDPQSKELSTKLRKIIKDHHLKANFEATHFFCTTVNNYASLQKIIEIIGIAQGFENLSDPVQQKDLLYYLIQLGEYMSHRKLANRFQELYPNVSWKFYQILRDCLCHPENGENHRLTQQLLAGHLELDGISLQKIQEELEVLKKAVIKIIEKHFHHPQSQFYNEYCQKYQVKRKWTCSPDDQAFILDNLNKPDQTIRQAWQAILSGESSLPQGREYGDLKRVIFKAVDLNKKTRERFNQILKDLSPNISSEACEFLRQHLRDCDQRANAEELLKQVNTRELSKKEKCILRDCCPEVNYGKDTEKHVRTQEILNKLEEVREQGCCILYPRQLKLINKRIESKPIFITTPERWSRLLNNEAIIPTVEEYFKLCECIIPDQMENTQNEFSQNMMNIYEIIRSNFEKRLQRQCANIIQPHSLNMFFNLLDQYPNIRYKWWRVLFREIKYPSLEEFKEDLNMIRMISHEDAKEFITLTVQLQEIQSPTPVTCLLKDLFERGYQEIDPEQEKSSENKRRICSIAIEEMTAMSSIILEELFGEEFYDEIMHDIVSPTFNASINMTASINPSYERFLQARRKLQDNLLAESIRTGQPVRLPLEEISRLYREMVIEDPREKLIEKHMYATSKQSIKQAFRDQHQYGLPREIHRNSRFQFALEFHLTRCLSLLKLIVKFADPECAPFLIENYMHLKKCRNDLIHGDYIKESMGQNLKEITVELSKNIDAIKRDLVNSLKRLEEDNAHLEKDREPPYSPRSPRFYKQPSELPSENAPLPDPEHTPVKMNSNN